MIALTKLALALVLTSVALVFILRYEQRKVPCSFSTVVLFALVLRGGLFVAAPAV